MAYTYGIEGVQIWQEPREEQPWVEGGAEPALTKGKRKVWRPYMRLMAQGYPDLCACMCVACLGAFRGDSSWERCPLRS